MLPIGRSRCRVPESFLRDHSRKGIRAADDVDMQMIHVLSSHPTGVDDGPEAVGRALLAGERAGLRHHLAEHLGVLDAHVRQRIHVLLGDDHEVHRRERIDVVEGEHVVVLVHLAAGDLAGHDLAEDAVVHGALPFGREAFSSSPERPSRRSSSASTSPTDTPCHASITRQWNQRSALSWTIEPRSPLLEAITVSTASSATFLRIWSRPLALSEAT